MVHQGRFKITTSLVIYCVGELMVSNKVNIRNVFKNSRNPSS